MPRIPNTLPRPIRRIIVTGYDFLQYLNSEVKEIKNYGIINSKKSENKELKNILIYHISGLNFGGTEKNLQILANELADKYNIYFLYSNKGVQENRKSFMSSRVNLIEFNYDSKGNTPPYFIYGMNPHIKKIINDNKIDLIITATEGHSNYPLNTIKNIPIILINIFGSPSTQSNIVRRLFVSDTVKKYSEYYVGKQNGSYAIYNPITSPSERQIELGRALRGLLGISDDDFVFGRIGRPSNEIYDPIGIKAFEKVIETNKNVHYIIMAPPTILTEYVNNKKIENVHFLKPSSNEDDMWAFHTSLDAMAHFRFDGETCGLSIAESMIVGNPIISHKSTIWNAHLEYLTRDFSLVSDVNNIDEYASNMKEFIRIKNNEPEKWLKMKQKSKEVALLNFSTNNYIKKIEDIVRNIK